MIVRINAYGFLNMENKEASVMKGKKGWKQRACLCLMVFLIGLPGLAGASSRDDIYREELDILYAMVQSGSSYILFGEERDDLMAVWEGVRDLSPEQGLEAVKYQLLDCNGDGKPELLIGQDNRLTNLFTIRDGQLHQVFSGFYRNAWYYLGNGRFLNQGSGGASLSILGEYHLDGNGNLVCESYYFTHWDPAVEKMEVYWNTFGVSDITLSEKKDMTMDQFGKLQEKLRNKVKKLSWKSLDRYGKGRVDVDGKARVTAAGKVKR